MQRAACADSKSGSVDCSAGLVDKVGPKLILNGIAEQDLLGANIISSSGQTYPLVCSTGIRRLDIDGELPCTSGFVGDSKVVVMRDTDCSSVIVKRDLVSDSEFTGKEAYVRAFDGTVRKYPMVKVDVDTPYFVGNVEAVCVPEPVYDLIIGNVSGAGNPDNPDPEWVQSNAVTRAQAKRSKNLVPLKVLDGSNGDPVDKARLI